jgi:hypothetical protein
VYRDKKITDEYGGLDRAFLLPLPFRHVFFCTIAEAGFAATMRLHRFFTVNLPKSV